MDLNQALVLIADFLKEQNLPQSYSALVQEAGLAQPGDAQMLCSLVDAEDWPGLITKMNKCQFKHPQALFQQVYQHIVCSMIVLNENFLA
jgi:hypothetical protein